ncbi:MAG: ABC transporter substrate-binding protein [Pseudomonadota bacterium]
MKKLILAGVSVALAATCATAALAAGHAETGVSIGLQLEPPHLDPTAGAAGAIDDVTYANVFEGLTRINQNGEVLPALATSWAISDDGLTYVFTLAEGVTFHDGTTFDAEDAKFSLDRIAAEESENAQKALYAAIESVEATDATTLTVKLSQADGKLLFSLGWGDAVMVAPESAGDNKSNPVGTGPFKFDEWTKGSSLTLTKNTDYWGDAVALEEATFRFISDPAAAFNAMMSRDLDAFPNFPAPENIVQFEADPRFDVVIGSTEGETILSTNNAKPPFDNLKVRQAMAHAINRQSIIDGAMFGYGTPIGTHFAPHHPAYKDLTGAYEYDPEKAKALLAEAGFPDGFQATIKLPPPAYARRGGEIIAADLRKIGIELQIIPVEWNVWLPEVFRAKDYDLTIVSHTEPLDIGIYARDDYYFQFDNDAFDALIEQVNAEADPEKANALYAEAQQILSDNAVNGFLFQLAKHGVWNKDLKGMWENAPIQGTDLTGVSWAE